MSLFNSLKDKKFDRRMLEWNLKNGVITQQEYDQYVSSLEDSTDRSESLQLEEPAGANGSSIDANGNDAANGATSMHGSFQH